MFKKLFLILFFQNFFQHQELHKRKNVRKMLIFVINGGKKCVWRLARKAEELFLRSLSSSYQIHALKKGGEEEKPNEWRETDFTVAVYSMNHKRKRGAFINLRCQFAFIFFWECSWVSRMWQTNSEKRSVACAGRGATSWLSLYQIIVHKPTTPHAHRSAVSVLLFTLERQMSDDGWGLRGRNFHNWVDLAKLFQEWQ